MNKEISHYVVTAHPPGGVLMTAQCNFLSPVSQDVLVAKSRRLEVRQLRASMTVSTTAAVVASGTSAAATTTTSTPATTALPSPFPVLIQVPINGRLVALHPFSIPALSTSCVFLLTEQWRYAVISYQPTIASSSSSSSLGAGSGSGGGPHPMQTHASGSLKDGVSGMYGSSSMGGAATMFGTGSTASMTGGSNRMMASNLASSASSPEGGPGGITGQQQHHHDGSGMGMMPATSSAYMDILGKVAETAPLTAMDPSFRCIALYLYDGLLTILPIDPTYQPPTRSVTASLKSATTASKNGDGLGTASGRTVMSTMMMTATSNSKSVLGEPFHGRIEESVILAMSFVQTTFPTTTTARTDWSSSSASPLLCILHQDARGAQHVTTHCIHFTKKRHVQLHLYGSTAAPTSNTAWLKKSNVDGGSAMLLPVPVWPQSSAAAAATNAADGTLAHRPTAASNTANGGGVLIVGQRQLTYVSPTTTKVQPMPQALILSSATLPPDPSTATIMPRFLLGDEFGNIHMVTLQDVHEKVVHIHLETLGSCSALSSCLTYLGYGLLFVGSTLGDSQLLQIHEDPIFLDDTDDDLHHHDMTRTALGPARGGGSGGGGGGAAGAKDQHLGDDDPDPNHELMGTTYLSVVEEFTHLGPILDFDLVPTTPGGGGGGDFSNNTTNQQYQCQVVTASGSSKSGSLRLIRNGIGMKEYAAVEIPGIQNMWSIRARFDDAHDTYLVQSFVGETRVLGVHTTTPSNMMIEGDGMDDDGDAAMHHQQQQDNDSEEGDVAGTLEEVLLPGLDSNASTLYMGNVCVSGDGSNDSNNNDYWLQITESAIRVIATGTGRVHDTWTVMTNDGAAMITVAAANEVGQIAVALQGGNGLLMYWTVEANGRLRQVAQVHIAHEISCMNLHPFFGFPGSANSDDAVMDVDRIKGRTSTGSSPCRSSYLAIGLWDDFTVRLLSLDEAGASPLHEVLCIHLSSGTDDEGEDMTAEETGEGGVGGGTSVADTTNATEVTRRQRNNMMARSLCLITLDYSGSSNSSSNHNSASVPGVNMLFVGLGDGTLISFAVVFRGNSVVVQSRKEVCLGTQRIDLVPLRTEGGGSCILATGDRPTVIYLAGIGAAGGANTVAAAHQQQQFNPKLCYSHVNLAAGSASEEEQEFVQQDDVSRPPSQQSIAVNVAAPFLSPLLFDGASLGSQHYSLCVADDAHLRLGVIDDIQKLHVTTCRLGMAPRRIVHCADGRLFAVGCIESGIKHFGVGDDQEDANMGNCIRFMDDTTFDDLARIDMEPYEMILSMEYAMLKVPRSSNDTSAAAERVSSAESVDGSAANQYKPFLLVGTAYALSDECETTRGRILVYSFQPDPNSTGAGGSRTRTVRQVAEFTATGGVYSIAQFYEGKFLCSVNTKTQLCQLVEEAGILKVGFVGVGHHGHILSLFVRSRAKKHMMWNDLNVGSNSLSHLASINAASTVTGSSNSKISASATEPKEMLAIVGDLMRSISLIQYYPQHQALEEIAKDYNANWTTAVEMLNDNVYLGAENWNNLYCLRRNTAATSEEIRSRLDIVGEFHLGEMCNKFLSGSLVMPMSATASGNNNSINGNRRAVRRSQTAPASKKKDSSTSKSGGSTRSRRPLLVTGSQTLFGTVDGTLGVILGLDARTAAFFGSLERAMAKVIRPVGDFSHAQFRAFYGERRIHPAHGFLDGDLIESFLDLDRATMEAIVKEMNLDGGWEVDDAVPSSTAHAGEEKDPGNADDADYRVDLTVDDVLAMVEEMTMLH